MEKTIHRFSTGNVPDVCYAVEALSSGKALNVCYIVGRKYLMCTLQL